MALRYIEVKKAILDSILQMEPNTRLPARSRLCEQYLVARATIDKAIKCLVDEGYLYATLGSGTYVSGFSANTLQVDRDVLNIGVLLPNILHDVYPGILRGIEDVMSEQGINVMICNTDFQEEKQHAYIRRLINSKIRGLILVSSPSLTPEGMLTQSNLLKSAKFPIVLCNNINTTTNYPIVFSNNFSGGFMAVRHLLGQGYRRIGFLSDMKYSCVLERFQGYITALEEAGIEVDLRRVRMPAYVTYQGTGGYNMMKDLIENGDIDAVFCFNDRIALLAIQAIHDAGRIVSDDIGVIGYDNTHACDLIADKLTSVSYKKYEIGRTAAQIMLVLLKHPDQSVNPLTVFQPSVVVRNTCLGPVMQGNGHIL